MKAKKLEDMCLAELTQAAEKKAYRVRRLILQQCDEIEELKECMQGETAKVMLLTCIRSIRAFADEIGGDSV